jgi:NAD(P)-dependent dehydrogenase (short-subunit alcohol dehydrogenase family)
MNEYPLALVTGAAHRLGRAFALALARQGYAILLHYHRSANEAASTADAVRAIHVPVYPVRADLTDEGEIQSLFSKLDSLDHLLKVLVNSASEMTTADLRTVSAAGWDNTLNLNLRAPFLLAQNAARRMTEGGLIVNVTDAGVGKAWIDFPAYQVSKVGLDTLTRLLARTFAPEIRVNAIAPGLVLPTINIIPEQWKKLVDRLPLHRPASLEDITLTLEFLLKNESITGQTIVVDDGYSLI